MYDDEWGCVYGLRTLEMITRVVRVPPANSRENFERIPTTIIIITTTIVIIIIIIIMIIVINAYVRHAERETETRRR